MDVLHFLDMLNSEKHSFAVKVMFMFHVKVIFVIFHHFHSRKRQGYELVLVSKDYLFASLFLQFVSNSCNPQYTIWTLLVSVIQASWWALPFAAAVPSVSALQNPPGSSWRACLWLLLTSPRWTKILCLVSQKTNHHRGHGVHKLNILDDSGNCYTCLNTMLHVLFWLMHIWQVTDEICV